MNTSVCRTCNVQKVRNLKLYELSAPLKSYPNKMLSDLLLELTNINCQLTSAELLPKHLCGTCNRKLHTAYEFVLQAREVNEKLYAQLKEIEESAVTKICGVARESPHLTDPLSVAKVEFKMNEMLDMEFMSVKTLYKAHEAIEKPQSLQKANVWQLDNTRSDPLIEEACDAMLEEVLEEEENIIQEQDYENPDDCGEEDDDSASDYEPVKHKSKKRPQREKIFKCDKCSKSFDWPNNLKAHMRKHASLDEWYSCKNCDRKFYRRDSLYAHLRSHGEEVKLKCKSANYSSRLKTRATSVDINLCKPNGGKVIQCMICQRTFQRIAELCKHLHAHPKLIYEECKSLAETRYGDVCGYGEDHLLSRIREDLNEGKYALFASVTNQWGYELSLTSSDTEAEAEMGAKCAQSERSYGCELCKVRFSRKYQLFAHQKQAHAWLDAQWVCGRCDGRFVSRQILKHHQRTQCQNRLKRFICAKCPLRFSWKHNLQTHFREHRQHETVVCFYCKLSFREKNALTAHMRREHANKAKFLNCKWCDHKFYRRDCLLQHMERRHGIPEQDVPLAEALAQATSRPNGRKCIVCKICNVKFAHIEELRVHMLEEPSLHDYDSFASYSITNEIGYELHIEDSETDDDEKQVGEGEGEADQTSMYTCELCFLQCRRKFQIMQHQRTIHRFAKLPHECERCVFKCVSKNILEQHMRTQCMNKEKPLSCEICNYKFMWLENLDLHKRLQHAQESNWPHKMIKKATGALQCPHCDKKYFVQGCLNNHIKDVHVDANRKKKEAQRRYLCSICGFQAISPSKLVVHSRIHTGEKPFKCDFCDARFTRRYQVSTHRRMHTGERPYQCTVCEKRFSSMSQLLTHNRTHLKN